MSSLGCYLLYTHILQCTPASLGLIPPASAAVLREGGEESPGGSGGTARHYRLPKQQQALLSAMCNNPATTAPRLFLSRNVCAMWFGGFSVWFLGGVGGNVPDQAKPPSIVNPSRGERLARTRHQVTPCLIHRSQAFSSSHIPGLEQDQTAGPLPLVKRKSTIEQIFIQIFKEVCTLWWNPYGQRYGLNALHSIVQPALKK